MKKTLVLVLVGVLAVFGLALLAGCGSSTTTTSAPATTATTAPAASTTTMAPASSTTMAPVTTTTAGTGIPVINPPVTVKLAFDDAPGTAALILADQMGFFKNVGINITWIKFASGADMYTALAAGKTDVGRGIITASMFNGAALGVNVWITADSGTNVPGKKNFFGLVVRKDLANTIKTYADLKGKKVIIASKGSINELFLSLALAKAGLTTKDVTEVIVDSFPDMNTALGNKAADVAVQIEPLITGGEQAGILVPFPMDASDYAPNEQIAVLEYSDAFAKNTAVANAFMVAYLQGVRTYNDALITGTKDQANVVAILSKATFVTDPKMWTTMNPTGLNVDGTVDPAAVARDQAFYAAAGLVPTTVPVTDIIDSSFSQYAVGVLGPYTPPAQ